MFDSFNNCLIVVRYGFNLVFVVRMVLDVRLNWLYDVKKVQRHPIQDSEIQIFTITQQKFKSTFLYRCDIF